jgi:20S proteasome subunit alpha 6
MSIDRFERASTAASAEPSVAETASEGDWLMAAIGEDEGDGDDDGGELQLSGNDPNSRDGSTYVAEGDYGEFESPLFTVGVCVGVGSGALG